MDSLAESLISAVWGMGVESKWLSRKKDLCKLPQIPYKIPVKVNQQILKQQKLKNNRELQPKTVWKATRKGLSHQVQSGTQPCMDSMVRQGQHPE